RGRVAQAAAAGRGAWKHLVVVVPEWAVDPTLREAAREALAGIPLTVLDGEADASDELLVAWETARLALPELAAGLAGDDPMVAGLAEKGRTRKDGGGARGGSLSRRASQGPLRSHPPTVKEFSPPTARDSRPI